MVLYVFCYRFKVEIKFSVTQIYTGEAYMAKELKIIHDKYWETNNCTKKCCVEIFSYMIEFVLCIAIDFHRSLFFGRCSGMKNSKNMLSKNRLDKTSRMIIVVNIILYLTRLNWCLTKRWSLNPTAAEYRQW